MKKKNVKKEVKVREIPQQESEQNEHKPKAKKKSVLDYSNQFENLIKGKQFYVFLGIILLIGIIVYGDFLSLNTLLLYKDIGSDSFNVFYPTWTHQADLIRSDGIISKWTFSQGMGQSIFSGYLFFFNFPQQWILPILGSETLAYGIAWQQFITILLSGIFFYGYLKTLNLSNYISIIGGVLYTFSGYIVLGSSGWYGMPYEGMLFSLLLFSFELLFKKKIWWLFPIAIFYLGIYNTVFYGLFLFIYATFRYIDEYDFKLKDYSIFLMKMAGLGFIGLLINASSILPGWLNLYESPRFSGSASYFNVLQNQPVFAIIDKFELFTGIMRAFSNDMTGTGNQFLGARNYLEAPLFYAGLLNLLLFPQIFSFISNKKRILYLVLLLLWILPIFFPYFRYAYYFFAGDYWRLYSFFVAVILLYLSLNGLQQIIKNGKINLIVLAVTLVLLLVALYYPYYTVHPLYQGVGNPVNKDLRTIVTIILIFYTGILVLHNYRNLLFYGQIALLVMVMVELSYFSYITVNKRITLSSEEFEQKVGYNDYSKEAIQFIKSIDKSFFRIEKDYFSSPAMHGSLNDAKVHNYYGTSSYSSFNQLYYINFLQAVNIIQEGNETQTRWAPGLRGRAILESFGSVKYFISKGNSDYPRQVGYELIGTAGNVNIFRNRNYLPLGFCYDKYITYSEFKNLSNMQKDIALLRCFVVDDKDVNKFPGFSRYNVNDTVPNYSFEQYNYDINERRKDTLTILKHNHNQILGKITITEKKLLFFSIPFDMGWTAKIDGQDIKPDLVNVGFWGIPVEKGDHKIKIEFKPRYAMLGNILSGIGILLYIGMIIYFKKKKQN